MGFKSFQRNYLIVYTIVMFSDWLQGSYIYPLYREYGYSLSQISYLFVAGFMSSAVFGTFVGSVADKWGRKKLAVAFCLIYMISCFTKLSPNYNTLIMGRVLAGIATSLLSSVFESWMVCEHYSRDYEEAWLQTTFALGTWLNGVAAIGSGKHKSFIFYRVVTPFLTQCLATGIIANALVKPFGNVSPFILAALTLLVPAIIILGTWTENYGSGSTSTGAKFEDNERGTSWWVVLKMVFSDRKIFAVGTIQFTFEAAMFCWIFLWSPVLEKAAKTSNLPFGLIFSTFMLAIMTGSMLYEILIARQWSHAGILRIACTIASLSFIICILIPATSNPHTFNFFFTLFELSVGLYYPSLSTIRSSILPEQIRSTLLNIFRVPLNLIVVVMLINIDNIPYQYLFAMLAGLSVISTWMTAAIAIDRTGQSPGKGEGKNRGRGRSKERESTNLLDGSGGKGFDGHSEMRGVHIDD
ncbi:hypothetical protein BKA69DRAFT_1032393 [Paraphysoderma sedebokerense]|nr:hypothetical protein BKA69DRAFT_1032393 [Paraphysoderma sedebokerense]